MKRIIALLLCVISLLTFVACSDDGLVEYSHESGITVRLPEGYREGTLEGAVYMLYGDDGFFIAVRDSFADLDKAYDMSAASKSVAEYGTFIVRGYGLQTQLILQDKERAYFTYTKENSAGEEFFYYAAVRKGSDAFWLCQYVCKAELSELHMGTFEEWSQKITLD